MRGELRLIFDGENGGEILAAMVSARAAASEAPTFTFHKIEGDAEFMETVRKGRALLERA